MNEISLNQSAEIEDIYTAFKGRVYQYMRNRAVNQEDAEDLLSCVFLKIQEKIHTYDSNRASLSTWIYAITRNTLNDYLRRQYKTSITQPYDHGLIDYADDDLPAIDRLVREEQLEELGAALEQLPEREREIIILRFFMNAPRCR